MKSSLRYPIIALIITNIIWGAASPIFKYALGNIPPFTLAFIRFFGAGILFIPFVLRNKEKISARTVFFACMTGFFAITINISFFFLGLQRAPSINAPIITSSAPIFLFLLSIFFLKEKPIKRVFFGMLVGLSGVLIIVFSPFFFGAEHLALGQLQGNIFFILAMSGMVIKPILMKKFIRKINIFTLTFIEFIFGAITFFPFMVYELHSWSFAELDGRGMTGIVFGVFLSSALAYFLFNWGIDKLQTQEVGLFYYIDPVVALLVAIPLLHEYPTIYYFAGALLVFVGIFIAEGRLHYHPIQKIKQKVKVSHENR